MDKSVQNIIVPTGNTPVPREEPPFHGTMATYHIPIVIKHAAVLS